jgi:hypothetical protein
LGAIQESYKQIQNENYQLRDYIINLQSRLIESQGEDAVPPPPAVLVHPANPVMMVNAAVAPAAQVAPTQPQNAAVAPTANMGVGPAAAMQGQQPVVPIPPQHVLGEIAAAAAAAAAAATGVPGQKRARDDTGQFLQTIAQAAAAGSASNGMIPSVAVQPAPQVAATGVSNPPGQQQQQQQQQKAVLAKTSPASKRIKSEPGKRNATELKNDGANAVPVASTNSGA